MHLLIISLLSILAGTLLLAKFRKEEAGRFFRIISWFFIVVGFLLFAGFTAGAVCKWSHCDGCNHGGMHKEVMIKKFHHGGDAACFGKACCPEAGHGACCDKGEGMEKCGPKEGCKTRRMDGHCREEGGKDSLQAPPTAE